MLLPGCTRVSVTILLKEYHRDLLLWECSATQGETINHPNKFDLLTFFGLSTTVPKPNVKGEKSYQVADHGRRATSHDVQISKISEPWLHGFPLSSWGGVMKKMIANLEGKARQLGLFRNHPRAAQRKDRQV
jgi:hypothetical protein